MGNSSSQLSKSLSLSEGNPYSSASAPTLQQMSHHVEASRSRTNASAATGAAPKPRPRTKKAKPTTTQQRETGAALRAVSSKSLTDAPVKPLQTKNNLYVRNFGKNITDESLYAMFRPFGNIVSAKVMMDERGVSKGFGFVCFTTDKEAEEAIKTLNDREIGTKKLLVTIQQSKEERKEMLSKQFSKETNSKKGSDDVDDKTCCICLTNPIAKICFVPCGHARWCKDCAKLFDGSRGDSQCPICRVKILSLIKIFD